MKDFLQSDNEQKLPDIEVPKSCNYIGIFLTLCCNLNCSYCINRYNDLALPRQILSAADWIQGLNRLQSRSDLPVTLQGGEPSLHPGFYDIINGIRPDLNIDLLTNLQFDEQEFMQKVVSSRLKREAPYASIRVSYHPESMDFDVLRGKVLCLLDGGYSVGVWSVAHPAWEEKLTLVQEKCLSAGIDFRLKEFLGNYNDRFHGTYFYPDAVNGAFNGEVECRTSELLVAPNGNIHRCHSDLYSGRASIGNIVDPTFKIRDGFRSCSYFGHCNPCDVKTKTNRFQEFGHTSVEIRFSGD